jgi:hypothetical protein
MVGGSGIVVPRGQQWRKILWTVTRKKGDLRSAVAYCNRGVAGHIGIITKSKEKGNKFILPQRQQDNKSWLLMRAYVG